MTALTETDAIKLIAEQGSDVIIPDSYTSIDYAAFASAGLTSVEIPSSVTYLSRYSFYDNKLTEVYLPDSITEIGPNAFEENSLSSVEIPYGSNIWLNFTLMSFDSGVKITRREEVKEELIFEGSDLVLTPEIATAIINNQGKDIVIPSNFSSISDEAFKGEGLTSVVIPNSITTIGDAAFDYNYLESVKIPDSVTSIGKNAFEDNHITDLYIGNNITSIPDSAFGGNRFQKVEIPDGVVSIGARAFAASPWLSEVIIPDSVDSIGDFAFLATNIKTLEIPGNTQNSEDIYRYTPGDIELIRRDKTSTPGVSSNGQMLRITRLTMLKVL